MITISVPKYAGFLNFFSLTMEKMHLVNSLAVGHYNVICTPSRKRRFQKKKLWHLCVCVSEGEIKKEEG